MRAHHITILAVVFFPFLATQALGGLPRSSAAWEKKAWADGKIDATERGEWDALTHKANVAAVSRQRIIPRKSFMQCLINHARRSRRKVRLGLK